MWTFGAIWFKGSIEGIFYAVDICINTMYLYLQYSFAKQEYEKYCKNLDNCCIKVIEHKAREEASKGAEFDDFDGDDQL